MTREEILHLGTLSRIALNEDELERLPGEISDIVEYVGVIQSLIGDESEEPAIGARYNVLRPDTITNKTGEYSEVLLAAAPHRAGAYLKVKKIIAQDE